MPPSKRIAIEDFHKKVVDKTEESVRIEDILDHFTKSHDFSNAWKQDEQGWYTSQTKSNQMLKHFTDLYQKYLESENITGDKPPPDDPVKPSIVHDVIDKIKGFMISTKNMFHRPPLYEIHKPHEELLKVVVVKKPNDIRIKIYPAKPLTNYNKNDMIIIGNLGKPISMFVPIPDKPNVYQTTIQKNEFVLMDLKG